jgi:hypothetical protein
MQHADPRHIFILLRPPPLLPLLLTALPAMQPYQTHTASHQQYQSAVRHALLLLLLQAQPRHRIVRQHCTSGHECLLMHARLAG